MSRERCEEVMRRYLAEVLGERKLEVISEIAAEDMVDHSQPEPGRRGPGATRRRLPRRSTGRSDRHRPHRGRRGHCRGHLALARDAGGGVLWRTADRARGGKPYRKHLQAA